MPLIITKGLGYLGNGSQSALLTTQGFGSTGAVAYPSCLAFLILAFTAGNSILTLTMSNSFTVSGPSADPTKFIITALDGGKAATVVGMSIAANVLTLITTEHTNGKNYSISVPGLGFVDTDHNPFNGPFTNTYVGVGVGPNVLLARSTDARTIEVVFSEPVDKATATNTANYTITPPLTVSSVIQITDLVCRLTTSRQTRDQLYTVVISNVQDRQGNPD